MKHLKTFEDSAQFHVGQIVVCINDFDSDNKLKNTEIYEIEKVHYNDYKLKLVEFDNIWYNKRFRPATPEEENIYNMRKDANKYNI